jgi:metal-responsive CopG/Arc/MetJ family transcriptional regulator
MSKMIAVRLEEDLLEEIDRERKRARLSRAAAIREALHLWIERRRYDEAVREEHEAYRRMPVRRDEFAPILRAQRWPRR